MLFQLKLEELYGPTEGGVDERREVIEAREEKDRPVEEPKSSEVGVKDEEDVEDEDEDEEDEEDPKPRSFGKVAMAPPHGGSVGYPPFPTVFASISLVSQVHLWPLVCKSDL